MTTRLEKWMFFELGYVPECQVYFKTSSTGDGLQLE
jgi:hypothetical protein